MISVTIREVDDVSNLEVSNGEDYVIIPLIGYYSVFHRKYHNLLAEYTQVINNSIASLEVEDE